MGAGIEPPGGGLEPQGDVEDCNCIVITLDAGDPLVIPKLKGPYLKGTFTVSWLPGSEIPGSGSWVTHMFLRWGNRIYLQPFYTLAAGDNSLCLITDEELMNLLMRTQILCYRQVETDFGLVGTPFVKELIITDRRGCDTPMEVFDDIIRGEITISVVPFTCPETP